MFAAPSNSPHPDHITHTMQLAVGVSRMTKQQHSLFGIMEEFDEDSQLRPTIITPSNVWTKKVGTFEN